MKCPECENIQIWRNDIEIRPAFPFSLIMKLNSSQRRSLHFIHSADHKTHVAAPPVLIFFSA